MDASYIYLARLGKKIQQPTAGVIIEESRVLYELTIGLHVILGQVLAQFRYQVPMLPPRPAERD